MGTRLSPNMLPSCVQRLRRFHRLFWEVRDSPAVLPICSVGPGDQCPEPAAWIPEPESRYPGSWYPETGAPAVDTQRPGTPDPESRYLGPGALIPEQRSATRAGPVRGFFSREDAVET
jgi:hypothetical protein